MAFTPIILTGTFDPALTGYVTFTLTDELIQTGLPMYPATPVSATVDGTTGQLDYDGSAGIPLVANDDGSTTPQGSGYLVQEYEPPGALGNSYVVIIPSAAPGGTIDLADLPRYSPVLFGV